MERLLTPEFEQDTAWTAAIVEDQLRGGFLSEIANAKTEELPNDITPQETAEIIVPSPKDGESLQPRWILVEAAEPVKEIISSNSDTIISTVEKLGLRRLVDGERKAEDTDRINPEKAFFLVESGANKTSIVRRGVAIKAMHEVYGEDLSDRTLYQLGGNREVKPNREITKPDGTSEIVANAEYKIVSDLAAEFLPESESFTEFDANLATALAEGYVIENKGANIEGSSRAVTLNHPESNRPKLVIVQPNEKGGLEKGFNTLRSQLEGSQPVIATNGQYRQKDLYQVSSWANENGLDIIPPIAVGDEPGDSFAFKDSEVVVPARPETAYVNELVILWRLAMKQLPNRKI